jgi:uncharacterized protein with FMN-binding domain
MMPYYLSFCRIIPVHVKDRRDGNYVISYTPDRPGQFSLNISIKGKPIKVITVTSAVSRPFRMSRYAPVDWNAMFDAIKQE